MTGQKIFHPSGSPQRLPRKGRLQSAEQLLGGLPDGDKNKLSQLRPMLSKIDPQTGRVSRSQTLRPLDQRYHVAVCVVVEAEFE